MTWNQCYIKGATKATFANFAKVYRQTVDFLGCEQTDLKSAFQNLYVSIVNF